MVDENVDGVAVELLQLGLGDEAGDAEVAGGGSFVAGFALPRWGFGKAGAGEVHLGGGGEHEGGGVLAEDLEEAFLCVSDCGRNEQGLCCGVEFEVLRWVSQGVVRDQSGDMRELGLFRLEELAAGRGVEEEIADLDGCSGGKAGVFGANDLASGYFDYSADGLCVSP